MSSITARSQSNHIDVGPISAGKKATVSPTRNGGPALGRSPARSLTRRHYILCLAETLSAGIVETNEDMTLQMTALAVALVLAQPPSEWRGLTATKR